MRRQLPLAGADDPGPAAPHARARPGVIVNVSSLGGRLGIPHEAAYSRQQVRAVRLERGDGHRPVVAPASRCGSSCPAPSTPRSGTSPATTPRSTTARWSRRRRWPTGIIAAIEGDAFEHYLPDMKAIVEFKTGDIDTFLAGAARWPTWPMPGAVVKALVPDRPRAVTRAADAARLLRNLAPRRWPGRSDDPPLGPTTGWCCATG